MHGIRVEEPDDVEAAVREALAHDGPVAPRRASPTPTRSPSRPSRPSSRAGASRSPRRKSSSRAPSESSAGGCDTPRPRSEVERDGPASPTVSGVIRGYRPDLDGLRTVAVYLVLAVPRRGGLGRRAASSASTCSSASPASWSPACCSASSSSTGTLRIGRFYARRVRRLLPAAVLVVVATCLVFTLLWSVVPRLAIIGDARSALLYYANWHFLASSGDYFAADVDKSPFLHFWSLVDRGAVLRRLPAAAPPALPVPRRVARARVTLGVLGALLVASLAAQLVLAPRQHRPRLLRHRHPALPAAGRRAARPRGWPAPPGARRPRVAHAAGVARPRRHLLLGSGLLPLGPSGRGVGATAASVLLLGGLALRRGPPALAAAGDAGCRSTSDGSPTAPTCGTGRSSSRSGRCWTPAPARSRCSPRSWPPAWPPLLRGPRDAGAPLATPGHPRLAGRGHGRGRERPGRRPGGGAGALLGAQAGPGRPGGRERRAGGRDQAARAGAAPAGALDRLREGRGGGGARHRALVRRRRPAGPAPSSTVPGRTCCWWATARPRPWSPCSSDWPASTTSRCR